jgi:hypothetical protein
MVQVDMAGRGGKLMNQALELLKPKELSLAIGAEYRVIKPIDGHEVLALKDGQIVKASLAVGDVVTANEVDSATVPFEGTTILRINTGDTGWVSFDPQFLEKVGSD